MLNFSFNLIDSYGDGWNGASVNLILNNQIIIADATITNEQKNSNTYSFQANIGDKLELVWTSGSYNSEISWNIHYVPEEEYPFRTGKYGDTGPYLIKEYSTPDLFDNINTIVSIINNDTSNEHLALQEDIDWVLSVLKGDSNIKGILNGQHKYRLNGSQDIVYMFSGTKV